MREQQPPHYTTADTRASRLGVRSYAVWILIGISAIFAVTGAYFWGASNASVTKVDILIPTPEPVILQVVGEVLAPGVYELNADDRVLTAIEAAGGPTRNADIEKINLAAFNQGRSPNSRAFSAPYVITDYANPHLNRCRQFPHRSTT